MFDHFFPEPADVTARAKGKDSDDLGRDVVDLVLEGRDLLIVHVLGRVVVDKVQATTLHDQVFSFQLACLVHLVEARFLVHSD